MALASLQNMIPYSHKVTVYCPSRDSNGQPIPNADAILDHVLAELSGLFGGATASKALGCWVGESGKVVQEGITVVFAYAQELNDDNVRAVLSLCNVIKTDGQQEAVALEIDGSMYFI